MFETRQVGDQPDAIAPDGSEVRFLCRSPGGSMAHFRLGPGGISRPIAHRTIDEIWYVVAGEGRMWRWLEGREEIVDLHPGVSISLPVGTKFQFRCDGAQSLDAVGVALPPWPGDDEAVAVDGPWVPTEKAP